MRMIVPLAAGLVLLAPMTGFGQEQKPAQEPVVGLYEYPVPLPARVVYEEDMRDAEIGEEGRDEAYEMSENEGDYSEQDEEGMDLSGYDDDLDLVDVIEQMGELADNSTAKVRFFQRQLPNGVYEWAVVEHRELRNGEIETVVISCDAENGFEEIHIVDEEMREHSTSSSDKETTLDRTLE